MTHELIHSRQQGDEVDDGDGDEARFWFYSLLVFRAAVSPDWKHLET